jgi:hypothetical protein
MGFVNVSSAQCKLWPQEATNSAEEGGLVMAEVAIYGCISRHVPR